MPTPPKKILIDARMAGTENAGIGRSTLELIKNLIKLDAENEYYIFLTKENFSLPDNWFSAEEQKNIHKILINARWYTLKEQLVLPREIKKINPDLVYFPHFNVPFFYRGKYVVTIHDLIWIKYPRPRREISTLGPVLYGIKNFFSKIIFRHAVKRAQIIVTPTEFTKKDIIDFYKINPEKIKVINWGIKSPQPPFAKGGKIEIPPNPPLGKGGNLETSDNILKKCYNIDRQYFLYVGSAYPHKNLIFLLEVFKKINKARPDFQLVLAGKESYFYDKLKQKTKELGFENEIIFTGYVNDENLNLLYKGAFAFIFPSLLEGFGLPPLEAMKFGVPSLSSNSSCLPEIFGDAVLYFDPTNKKDLEEKILSIIDNQNLREKLIRKGFEQIKKYDWRVCAQEYLNVINSKL